MSVPSVATQVASARAFGGQIVALGGRTYQHSQLLHSRYSWPCWQAGTRWCRDEKVLSDCF